MKTRMACVLVAAGLCLACGGEDESAESAARTTATPEAAAPANSPPVIQRLSLHPADFQPGDQVRVEAEIDDADGDALTLSYRWTLDGQRTGDGSPVVQLSSRGAASTLMVEVIADDGRGGISRRSTRATAGNRLPSVSSVSFAPGYEVRVGDDIQASLRGSDPDGDPVEFEITWHLNDEALDVDGPQLPGDRFERGDEITLHVIASDGKGESEPFVTQPIVVLNTPPIIRSSPAGFDDAGAFDYQIEAEDADGDRLLRYALLEAPTGMTIDWLKGRVRWSPEAQQHGRHDVEIQVDDQHGGVVTQSFAIEVGPEDDDATPAAPAP